MIQAHICPNGNKIRKYESRLCSMCHCGQKGIIELPEMSEENLNKYIKEFEAKKREKK